MKTDHIHPEASSGLEAEVDGRAANVDEAVEVVVLAAGADISSIICYLK